MQPPLVGAAGVPTTAVQILFPCTLSVVASFPGPCHFRLDKEHRGIYVLQATKAGGGLGTRLRLLSVRHRSSEKNWNLETKTPEKLSKQARANTKKLIYVYLKVL